ncbi:MAG: hypothetical protein HQK63_16185 [Desulfamplus sp.]|nr:hypothetical protein [Desulfamplus sp.]
MKQILDELTNLAIHLGASGAEVIAANEISIEDDLAALCNGNPSCEHFSKSRVKLNIGMKSVIGFYQMSIQPKLDNDIRLPVLKHFQLQYFWK